MRNTQIFLYVTQLICLCMFVRRCYLNSWRMSNKTKRNNKNKEKITASVFCTIFQVHVNWKTFKIVFAYKIPFSFTHIPSCHVCVYVSYLSHFYTTFFRSIYVTNVMNINDHQLIKFSLNECHETKCYTKSENMTHKRSKQVRMYVCTNEHRTSIS